MDNKKHERSMDFKKKCSGIDSRSLRAHRRSQEWKQRRDDVVNTRRNISMSPVQEDDNLPNSDSVQNTPAAPKANDNKTLKPQGYCLFTCTLIFKYQSSMVA